MARLAVLVGVVLLMVLWPVAGAVPGEAGPESGSLGPPDVLEESVQGAISQAVSHEPPHTEAGTNTSHEHSDSHGHAGNDSEEYWLFHRDDSEPVLFNTSTTAEGEPAVGSQITITVTLTAKSDAENVTVSLGDYRFFEGDGRTFDLGTVETGENRTISVTVTPTEQVTRNLQFIVRATTGEGQPQPQRVSHQIAMLEDNSQQAIQLATESSDGEETTIDANGNRTDGLNGTTGSAMASPGYVEGDFLVGQPGGGGVIPVKGSRVEVWDEDGGLNPDDLLATGRTDDNGHFRVKVNNPGNADNDDTADIYVRIEAANPGVEVTTGATRVRYAVRDPSGTRGLRNGETVDLGQFTPSSDQPAFQAASWGYEAYDFVKSETGYTRRQLRIQYPKTDWPSYHPSFGSGGNVMANWEHVTLPARPDQQGQDWDRSTVHHEYAHGLTYSIYGYSKDNMPDDGPYSSHTIFSETNPGFASVEGFAQFMEAAIVDNGNVNGLESSTYFNRSPSNPTDSDGNSIPDSDRNQMDGNSVEGAYASIWWDLADGGPGDDDQINGSLPNVGFPQVFNTAKNVDPQSMRDFIDHWNHGYDEAVAITAFRYGVDVADPYQPNNQFSTAAPIGIETINATIGSGIDYYRVTVPRWTKATVDLDRLQTARAGDLDLVVYDSSQNRVAASETSSPNEDVSLSPTGTSPRTFYIEVDNDNGVPASYQLDLTGTLQDDSLEDNNRYYDAATIAADGTTQRLRLVNDTIDLYEVELIDEEQLNVSVSRGFDNAPASNNVNQVLDVGLYEDDGDLIKHASVAGNTLVINHTATYKDEYLIGVKTIYDPLSYDLTATADPPENDRFEPNDDRSSAYFTGVSPIDGIIIDGEDDWFAQTVSAGSELNVTLPSSPDSALRFTVYTPTGSYWDSAYEGESIVVHDTQSGPYYVGIEGDYEETSDYSLFIEEDLTPDIDVQPDRFEANDMFSTATNIGRRLSATSLSIVEDDDDFYRLGLNEGDTLQVNLTYNSSHMVGSPSLTLYGPGQVPLQNAGFGDQRSVTIQQDGVYYVEVSGSGEYPYGLTIEGNDEYEDNDVRGDAANWPTQFSGLGAILAPDLNASMVQGEDDWYALSLSAGQRLGATVEATERSVVSGLPQGYMNVSIYDSQGTRLAQSSPNGGTVAKAPADGTYYLRVHPWGGRDYTTDYQLSIDYSDGPVGASDDSIQNATLYVPGDGNETLQLSDGSDEDHFAVYLERGDGLEADLDFTGSSDIDIALYAPDGTILTQTVTGPLNSVPLSADTIATTDGYHYVRVHGTPSAQDYTLSAARVVDDEQEPNDDLLSATPVAFGTVDARLFEGTGGAFGREGTPDDEVDIYEVTVSEPTTLNATLTFDQHGVSNSSIEDGDDLDLAVLDSNGNELAGNVSTGSIATATAPVPFSGTYYVRVNATSLDTVTPYNLSIEREELSRIVGGVDSPTQYLNTPVTEPAGSLLAGTGQARTLQLHSGDNVSHVVQLREDERLNVSTSADGNLDIALYDESGFQLQSSRSVDGNESLSYVSPANGSYYVETTAVTESPVTGTLDASTTLLQNDRYEPNERFESATPIMLGSHDELEINFEDQDYYTLGMETGQQLTVETTFDGVEGPLELSVYSPEQELLAQDTSQERATTEIETQSAGDYYVRVQSIDGGLGSYTMSVATETPNNDPFESNDNLDAATTIQPGSFEGLAIAKGDRDYYAVELQDGERLDVEVDFEYFEQNLDLRLYGPERQVVATSYADQSDEFASYRAQSTGTHYIQVFGFTDSTGSYDLGVTTEPLPENDRFEDNDDFESVTTLEPGTYSDLQILQDDSDLYAVELSEGEQLAAAIDFVQSEGNLDMEVYGPERRTLGTSWGFDNSESVTVNASTGGTHYVHVYGVADAVAGYSLNLSTTGQTEPSEPTPADTDWPTFQYDTSRIGHVPGAAGPTGEPAAKWTYSASGGVVGSPAVAGETVYTGSDGRMVYALDSESGEAVWEREVDNAVRSAPAVHDGAVYVTTRAGTLYAFDAIEGTERWSFTTEGSIDNFPGVLSSPAVFEETVYYGSSAGTVYAVDAGTGEERWRFETENQIHGSPAIVGETVYIGSTDDHLYALDAEEGTERWSVDTGGEVESTPAVYEGAVYVGNTDGVVFAFDAESGEELWTYETDNAAVWASPVVVPELDGRVFVASGNGGRGDPGIDGHVYALDGQDGSEVWSTAFNGSMASSPAVVDNVLYVGNDDSNLYALNAYNGSVRWQFETAGEPPIFDDVTSSPAVADGVAYVGSTDGTFYAIEGTGAGGPEPPAEETEVAPIGNRDTPPTNLDDDELLEDIDGNGDGNIFDALAYYNNRNSETITANPSLFDFDGDGTAGTIFDALGLYNKLTG